MTRLLNSEDFRNEVLAEGASKYLVDFYAIWCGPCRMVGPVLDEISEEYPNDINVVKVDIDKSPDIASLCGITAVPTIFLFENGKPVSRMVGAQSKTAILSFANLA